MRKQHKTQKFVKVKEDKNGPDKRKVLNLKSKDVNLLTPKTNQRRNKSVKSTEKNIVDLSLKDMHEIKNTKIINT